MTLSKQTHLFITKHFHLRLNTNIKIINSRLEPLTEHTSNNTAKTNFIFYGVKNLKYNFSFNKKFKITKMKKKSFKYI